MGTRHHYRRSDLFLLRMWSEEAADGSGNIEWRGKVQRVVDGESHQFKNWRGLLDALSALVPGLESKRVAGEPVETLDDDAVT